LSKLYPDLIHIFFRHNEQLLMKNKKNLPASPPQSAVVTPVGTTQFGASLQFIKENNNGDPIPPILRQCVEFLDTPDGTIFQQKRTYFCLIF